MKTLYTKLTRERNPKFQQVTKIFVENGQRKVSKASLCKEGQEHINRMYENYEYFLSNGKNLLCPTKLKDNKIVFDFLTGNSLSKQLLECASDNDRDLFIKLLYEFKQYVYNFGDSKELFHLTDDYKEVFGEVMPNQSVGAKHLNIDLIFENLIEIDHRYVTIDYEWIFDFVIPYEFVFFRAIYNFFINHSKELEGFIEASTVYDLLGITSQDIEIFKEMDQNFLNYVYGKEYNYDKILLNYKKKAYQVTEIMSKTMLHTQLYYDMGDGFLPELCINKDVEVNDNKMVEIDFILPEGVKNIRFDPSIYPIFLYLKKIVLKSNTEERVIYDEFNANADSNYNRYLIYDHCDPQIIFENLNGGNSVKILFECLSNDINSIKRQLTIQIGIVNEHEYEKNVEIQRRDKEINMQKKELLTKDKEINEHKKMNIIYLEIIKSLRKELYVVKEEKTNEQN